MAGRKVDRSRFRSSLRRRSIESPLFVGLDAHKSSIVATVVDREGKRIDLLLQLPSDALEDRPTESPGWVLFLNA
jgi:Ethanolamine utilization protein EutJ (predicted chaperonin)